MQSHANLNRRRRKGAARRGVATLEVLLNLGVTLPIAIGLFFVARAACGRLFQIIEMLVTWPLL